MAIVDGKEASEAQQSLNEMSLSCNVQKPGCLLNWHAAPEPELLVKLRSSRLLDSLSLHALALKKKDQITRLRRNYPVWGARFLVAQVSDQTQPHLASLAASSMREFFGRPDTDRTVGLEASEVQFPSCFHLESVRGRGESWASRWRTGSPRNLAQATLGT